MFLSTHQSWSTSLKSTEKRQFRGTPSGSRPAFACRPALRSRQFYVFFRSFFVDFSREITKKGLKSTKKNKKGRKTAEKNVSTSFRVLQAPESWSKYTTHVFLFTAQEMYAKPVIRVLPVLG